MIRAALLIAMLVTGCDRTPSAAPTDDATARAERQAVADTTAAIAEARAVPVPVPVTGETAARAGTK